MNRAETIISSHKSTTKMRTEYTSGQSAGDGAEALPWPHPHTCEG
jgi:hypothetical protein